MKMRPQSGRVLWGRGGGAQPVDMRLFDSGDPEARGIGRENEGSADCFGVGIYEREDTAQYPSGTVYGLYMSVTGSAG